ncbi:hypothetical protein [Bacillus sp. REN3]|uniref:hypothetical protein n=1 Tax=Bacillus sp. REN3 TaxID=2802440 RepID=UPI001AEE166F|nr:hypothetical protein [Bacillus sp. REN3]
MKIQFWSKTATGKWAASLTLLFIVLMAVKLMTSAIMIRIPLSSPFISLFGLMGFVMGGISIMKNKDRALLTLLSILIGLLVLFWVTAEILFPH